jgi:hypothetical protein
LTLILLYSIDSSNLQASAAALQAKYPEIYTLYFNKILPVVNSADSLHLNIVQLLINNPSYKALAKDCDSVLGDLSTQKEEINTAFKYYNHYFPERSIPKVFFFTEEFSYNVVTDSALLGIGKHMFLGKEYKYYASFDYPLFLLERFKPEYMAPVAIKGYLKSEFPFEEGDKSMLQRMIYEGKILYMMDALFPNLNDTLKIEYTQAQMDWCNTFEADIWGNFLENKLLYNKDIFEWGKYINEAPFTPGLENDSAPRLGIYSGWQVVRRYMKEHSEVSLDSLMKTPNHVVLFESGYRP